MFNFKSIRYYKISLILILKVDSNSINSIVYEFKKNVDCHQKYNYLLFTIIIATLLNYL